MFRTTARNINTDSELPHTGVSSLHFESSHREELVSNVQISLDVKEQNNACAEQEKQTTGEKIGGDFV